MLFLPGAGGSADFWRPLGALLPNHGEKHYLAWPGLGAQPADSSVNQFDDLVAFAAEQLGEGPTDLLAQSMGGVVAMRLALRYPEKIRRIVLAATSGGIDLAGMGCEDWRSDYRREYPAAAHWITEHREDLGSRLPAVSHPTLLLWGEMDTISPVAVGQKLRRFLPDARLVVISGGAHDFVHRSPETALRPILEHLA